MFGHKNTNVFLHQSEAKTTATVWNWSSKIFSRYGPFPPAWKLSALWFFRTDSGYLHANPKPKNAFCYYLILTLGRTRSHTPNVGPVGKGWWNLPFGFWYVAVFWNDFSFSGKPLIFPTRRGIFYGWWRFWRSVRSPNMVVILDLNKN